MAAFSNYILETELWGKNQPQKMGPLKLQMALSPTILQIVNNLIRNKFQVRCNRSCPLILVLLKGTVIKPEVNALTSRGTLLYYSLTNDKTYFLCNHKENTLEFNKS